MSKLEALKNLEERKQTAIENRLLRKQIKEGKVVKAKKEDMKKVRAPQKWKKKMNKNDDEAKMRGKSESMNKKQKNNKNNKKP